MKAGGGGGGVGSRKRAAAPFADFLQREAEGQQVGTDRQGELQQEAAEEVVLGLLGKHTGVLGSPRLAPVMENAGLTFLGMELKFFPVATVMAVASGGFPNRDTLQRR